MDPLSVTGIVLTIRGIMLIVDEVRKMCREYEAYDEETRLLKHTIDSQMIMVASIGEANFMVPKHIAERYTLIPYSFLQLEKEIKRLRELFTQFERFDKGLNEKSKAHQIYTKTFKSKLLRVKKSSISVQLKIDNLIQLTTMVNTINNSLEYGGGTSSAAEAGAPLSGPSSTRTIGRIPRGAGGEVAEGLGDEEGAGAVDAEGPGDKEGAGAGDAEDGLLGVIDSAMKVSSGLSPCH